jgi:hypothetical protein
MRWMPWIRIRRRQQALDGALGRAKGGLLKAVFHVLGKRELPIATKGAVLGVAANAVETGLTRSTYVDPQAGGLIKRSPLLAGMTNGFSLAAVSGAGSQRAILRL